MELYVSGLSGPEDMKAILKETGAGLETIAFSIAENLDRFEETLESERQLIEDCHRPALSVHGPFLDLNPMAFDSLVRSATMTRFNQAYEAARRLRARKIIFHSGMIPTVYFLEGWAERMIDFWNEFLDGKEGITVLMENVLDREITPFAEIAGAVSHPDFGLCLDIGHAHCYSPHEVSEWAEGLKGQIRHVHLHDNDGTWDHHKALGDGTIPLEEILPALAGGNPGVSWTIECIGRKDVLKSVGTLRRILGQ